MSGLSKKTMVIGILVITLIIGVVSMWIFLRDSNGTLTKIRSLNPPFTAYYPSRLPDGVTISEKSLSYDDGVLIYTIATSSGALSLSQQPLPEGRLQTELPKTKELQVQAGKATITRFGHDRVIVTITNEESLLILNGSFKISDSELEPILQALKPAT